jgi:hypothetical protein
MAVAVRQDWRDAYDTRLDQIRWTRSSLGRAWLDAEAQRVSAEYGQRTRFLVETMYEMEEARLETAVPYFVSQDMCRVVESAAPSFAPEPIYPTDLLTLSGFVYFAKPLMIYDRFERPVQLAGFSWIPTMTGGTDHFDLTRVWTRDDEYREYLEERHRQGEQDGLSLALYQRPAPNHGWPENLPLPPLLPMHCTPWWWGMQFEGNEITEAGRPTGASHWWGIVQTTLRLMQQRIAAHHVEQAPRSSRRYAKRLDLDDHGVTVVTLRRERTPQSGEPLSEFHYSHRFIVHGFWRNQWYPAAGVHRQIYIADYEKGPEGAPLIVKPRAYKWTR